MLPEGLLKMKKIIKTPFTHLHPLLKILLAHITLEIETKILRAWEERWAVGPAYTQHCLWHSSHSWTLLEATVFLCPLQTQGLSHVILSLHIFMPLCSIFPCHLTLLSLFYGDESPPSIFLGASKLATVDCAHCSSLWPHWPLSPACGLSAWFS